MSKIIELSPSHSEQTPQPEIALDLAVDNSTSNTLGLGFFNFEELPILAPEFSSKNPIDRIEFAESLHTIQLPVSNDPGTYGLEPGQEPHANLPVLFPKGWTREQKIEILVRRAVREETNLSIVTNHGRSPRAARIIDEQAERWSKSLVTEIGRNVDFWRYYREQRKVQREILRTTAIGSVATSTDKG